MERVTDEERREVARNIRNADLTKHASYYEEVKGWDHVRATRFVLVSNLGSAIGIDKAIFSIDDLKIRLADLIEPEPERTCHIVFGKCFHPQDEDRCLDKDNEFFGFDYWQDCEFYGCRRLKAGCSECGAVFKGGYLTKNNYCQNCGARVIDDANV